MRIGEKYVACCLWPSPGLTKHAPCESPRSCLPGPIQLSGSHEKLRGHCLLTENKHLASDTCLDHWELSQETLANEDGVQESRDSSADKKQGVFVGAGCMDLVPTYPQKDPRRNRNEHLCFFFFLLVLEIIIFFFLTRETAPTP